MAQLSGVIWDSVSGPRTLQHGAWRSQGSNSQSSKLYLLSHIYQTSWYCIVRMDCCWLLKAYLEIIVLSSWQSGQSLVVTIIVRTKVLELLKISTCIKAITSQMENFLIFKKGKKTCNLGALKWWIQMSALKGAFKSKSPTETHWFFFSFIHNQAEYSLPTSVATSHGRVCRGRMTVDND